METKAKTDASLVWRRGAPPHVGWWNVTLAYAGDGDMWGWWSGAAWSVFVVHSASAEEAAECAGQLGASAGATEYVRWRSYYPACARVPRLDPTCGHWTYNVDGRMPDGLDPMASIQFVMRSGEVYPATAGTLRWRHVGLPGDIVAWRLEAA